MPLIIDVYNVLHTGGVLPPELAEYVDVEGLARLLGMSRYRNERVEMICDGSPQRPASKGRRGSGVVSGIGARESDEPPPEPKDPVQLNVNIQYSGPGQEADEVIAMLVRHSTAPRNLTVVSSDAAVLKAARRRKCRTLTSQQFLEHLALDAAASGLSSPARVLKPPGGLSSEQVEAWMELFEVDEAEAERAADEAKAAKRAEKEAAPTEPDNTPRNREVVLPQEILDEAERMLRRRGKQ